MKEITEGSKKKKRVRRPRKKTNTLIVQRKIKIIESHHRFTHHFAFCLVVV